MSTEMKFEPKTASFGRAQTFPLRLGWLPKACKQAAREPTIFSRDEAIAELGVGKNMVDSIRHWAEAADVLRFAGGKAELTSFGEALFGECGHDPYLEDEATLWLLHWKIVSRPRFFTAGFWLFNRFHKPEFSVDEATAALADDMQTRGRQISAATVNRDIRLAARMYSRGAGDDEDSLSTPFPALDLIDYGESNRLYRIDPKARETLPAAVVGYAAMELFAATEKKEMPARRNSGDDYAAIESAFRLSGDATIEKLDEAAALAPEEFHLREAAGVWQLFLQAENPDPRGFLAAVYERKGL